MNKKLRHELESLRTMEDRRQLVMLAHNTPLQKLVCVWPCISITEVKSLKKPAPNDTDSVSTGILWLWDHFKVDFNQLGLAVGVGPDVFDLYNQARFSLLIWPDGTINAEAGKYLSRVAQAAVTIPDFGRGAWDPAQHPDGDD